MLLCQIVPEPIFVVNLLMKNKPSDSHLCIAESVDLSLGANADSNTSSYMKHFEPLKAKRTSLENTLKRKLTGDGYT